MVGGWRKERMSGMSVIWRKVSSVLLVDLRAVATIAIHNHKQPQP